MPMPMPIGKTGGRFARVARCVTSHGCARAPVRLTLAAVAVAVLVGCGPSEAQLIASAKVMLDRRGVDGAIIQLKNALDKNPHSGEARLLMGHALLRAGDPAKAQIELLKARGTGVRDEQWLPVLARAMLAAGAGDKLIEQYGDKTLSQPAATADLKVALAGAYVARGHTDEARSELVRAVLAVPDHAAALVLRARLDAVAGNPTDALRQLDELFAREPGHVEALLLKGQVLLHATKEPEAALVTLRQVRHAHPESVAAHTALVSILMQQNKREQARAEFKQLLKVAPRHPDTLFYQAQFALEDKDYQSSREITQRLLLAMPDNVRVLVLAGAAEYFMQHYALADRLLARALKLAPGLLFARQMLAQTLMREGLADSALEVLQPVIDKPQADASSLGLAGEAYLQSGNPARAEAAFQRALNATPEAAGERASLAMAWPARGEATATTGELEAIAGRVRSTHADWALVSARLRLRDIKGALAAIDTLEKKLPDEPFVPTLRGRLLSAQGEQPGAAANFAHALLRQPNYFPAVDGLASIDLKAGRPELARQRLTAALKAEPGNFRAKMALAELDTQLGAPDAVIVTHLREAIRLDYSRQQPHLALIERLLFGGDHAGALVAAQDAATVLPNDAVLMDALGRAQIATGASQQAVYTFRKLAAWQPGSTLFLLRLADAHTAARDSAAAANALRQVLKLEPGNVMALRGQALLAVQDQRPQVGIAIAREIQQRKPNDAVGFALEGELESKRRNWDAAARAYGAALQRGDSSDLAIRLHRCLREAGQDTEAERMSADWRKANPKDSVFLYYLGDTAALTKDWSAAEAHYRAVLALQPRHAAALNNVAWLLATQRRPGAVSLAEQANALLPDRAPLLDTLALALEADNQLPKAVDTQRRAVAIDPKDSMLRLHLARLLIKQGNKSDARGVLDALGRLGGTFAGHVEVAALLKDM